MNFRKVNQAEELLPSDAVWKDERDARGTELVGGGAFWVQAIGIVTFASGIGNSVI